MPILSNGSGLADLGGAHATGPRVCVSIGRWSAARGDRSSKHGATIVVYGCPLAVRDMVFLLARGDPRAGTLSTGALMTTVLS